MAPSTSVNHAPRTTFAGGVRPWDGPPYVSKRKPAPAPTSAKPAKPVTRPAIHLASDPFQLARALSAPKKRIARRIPVDMAALKIIKNLPLPK